MPQLIPATGHVALIRHTPAKGSPHTTQHPVIAWDEHGNAHVHDPQWGGLRRAGEIDGYSGTQAAAPPVVAAIPAIGWTAEFKDDDGNATDVVVAWLVRADGNTEPLSVGSDGCGFDPTTVDNFVRLIGPGETL